MKAHSSTCAKKHSYFLQWLEVPRAKRDGKYFNDFKEKDWIGYSDDGKKMYHLSKQRQETESENRDTKKFLKIGFIYKSFIIKHYMNLLDQLPKNGKHNHKLAIYILPASQ